MTISVERLRSDEQECWDQFVDKYSKATIYHTNWWHQIIISCFRHKFYSLVARTFDGHICGILPLFYIRGLLRSSLVSSPLRDRGGVLGNAEARRALAGAAIKLAKDLNCSYLLLKQGEKFPELDAEQYERLDYWVTMVIDLPLEWNNLNSKVRWSVRKAERSGLSFEIINNNPSVGDRFFHLFKETRRRLGVPTYTRQFFHFLANQSTNVCFCFASQNGKDLAGIILLHYGNKVLSGYAANSKLGRAFRASDFAFWHAIHWASKNGYSKFDFGADSPNQTSLREFKKKWGGVEETISHYYYLNRINTIPVVDSSKGFLRLARKLWSCIPDPLFEMFSRWAMRFTD